MNMHPPPPGNNSRSTDVRHAAGRSNFGVRTCAVLLLRVRADSRKGSLRYRIPVYFPATSSCGCRGRREQQGRPGSLPAVSRLLLPPPPGAMAATDALAARLLAEEGLGEYWTGTTHTTSEVDGAGVVQTPGYGVHGGSSKSSIRCRLVTATIVVASIAVAIAVAVVVTSRGGASGSSPSNGQLMSPTGVAAKTYHQGLAETLVDLCRIA